MSNQEIATLSLTCTVALSFLILAISSWKAARGLESVKDIDEGDTTAITSHGDIIITGSKSTEVIVKLPRIVYGLAKVSAIGFGLSLIPLCIQIWQLSTN